MEQNKFEALVKKSLVTQVIVLLSIFVIKSIDVFFCEFSMFSTHSDWIACAIFLVWHLMGQIISAIPDKKLPHLLKIILGTLLFAFMVGCPFLSGMMSYINFRNSGLDYKTSYATSFVYVKELQNPTSFDKPIFSFVMCTKKDPKWFMTSYLATFQLSHRAVALVYGVVGVLWAVVCFNSLIRLVLLVCPVAQQKEKNENGNNVLKVVVVVNFTPKPHVGEDASKSKDSAEPKQQTDQSAYELNDFGDS